MQSFSGTVREAQRQGTLEQMLLAPLRVPEFVGGSILFPMAQSLFRTLTAVAVAVFGFGFWHHANPISAAEILFLPIPPFTPLVGLSPSFVPPSNHTAPALGP